MEPENESKYKDFHQQQIEKELKKKWHVQCPNCKMAIGSNKRPLHAIVVCGLCGYDKNKAAIKVTKKGEEVSNA